MTVNCGQPAAATTDRNAAQLRYDALISLVAKWNRVTSIAEAARTLVAGVKFVMALDAWRFVLLDIDDDGRTKAVLVIEGNLNQTTVAHADTSALSMCERDLLRSGAPIALDEQELCARRIEIPSAMRGRGFRFVYGTASAGPTGVTDHALVIGTRATLSPLDLKFAGLVAGLFADKVRQLRAEDKLRRAYEHLAQRDAKIHADLCESRDFQRSLLPSQQHVGGLEIATIFEPLDIVGGDIYDLSVLADGRLRVFLVDATGHGLQAAMRTMVLLSEYNNLKHRAPTPGDLLRSLNLRLAQHHAPLELLSPAVCADIEPGGGARRCLIANAGAPPTLLASMNGTCEPLEPNGSMLLGMGDEIVLEEITATLAPGDRLLFATDGLYEQRCPAAQPFAYEPCKSALTRATSVVDCAAALRLMFDMHRGNAPRDDDMTGILIGVAPTTTRS